MVKFDDLVTSLILLDVAYKRLFTSMSKFSLGRFMMCDWFVDAAATGLAYALAVYGSLALYKWKNFCVTQNISCQ